MYKLDVSGAVSKGGDAFDIDQKNRPVTNAIVTACDAPYFWGALLLVASVRYSGGRLPIFVVGAGLSRKQIDLLTQFDAVSVYEADFQFPHLHKADALSVVDTDYITWLDADCIYVGNIDALLVPDQGDFQIRMRDLTENEGVFRGYHVGFAQRGAIPQSVLKVWQRDVGEESISRYHTQCVSNAFCFHRSQLPFLRKWQHQLERISGGTPRTVNWKSLAYPMTDESVLSALLCFASRSPRLSPYRLNDTAGPHLKHFGQLPKPWKAWRLQHFPYFDYLQKILAWMEGSGYEWPPLPKALQPTCRQRQYYAALARQGLESLKLKLSKPFCRKGRRDGVASR